MNGIFGLLTVLFVGLKLTGFIAWSWWLVLLPLYGLLTFALLLMLIGFLGVAFYSRKLNKLERRLR